jgi:hypothetical protein
MNTGDNDQIDLPHMLEGGRFNQPIVPRTADRDRRYGVVIDPPLLAGQRARYRWGYHVDSPRGPRQLPLAGENTKVPAGDMTSTSTFCAAHGDLRSGRIAGHSDQLRRFPALSA